MEALCNKTAALEALTAEIVACTACELHHTRTHAVPGEGDANAGLMFVGEAPGYHEDQQGRPFVGRAGKLLDKLLASIELSREQVFIANVLKSRPPNNRDPQQHELAACQPYLWRQIEIVRPRVICTLGNHATKFLTGNPAGITRVHGRPQKHVIAGVELVVYPIFHPAAALYTPSMLQELQADVLRLPALLAEGVPEAASAPEAGESAASAPEAGEPASLAPPAVLASESAVPEPAAEAGEPAAPAPEIPRAPVAPARPAGRSAKRAAEPPEYEQLGLF